MKKILLLLMLVVIPAVIAQSVSHTCNQLDYSSGCPGFYVVDTLSPEYIWMFNTLLPRGFTVNAESEFQKNVYLTFGSNLGIGTAAPTESLDVVGNIIASGQVCDSTGCGVASGGGGGGLWTDVAGNATRMTGSVGIGTTTPSARLDVSGNIAATGTIVGAGIGSTMDVVSVGNVRSQQDLIATGDVQVGGVIRSSGDVIIRLG